MCGAKTTKSEIKQDCGKVWSAGHMAKLCSVLPHGVSVSKSSHVGPEPVCLLCITPSTSTTIRKLAHIEKWNYSLLRVIVLL